MRAASGVLTILAVTCLLACERGKTPNSTSAVTPASAASPVVAASPNGDNLRPLQGVDCELGSRGGSIRVDADGNIVTGNAIFLRCEGKPVDLVDGKITDNELATKSFGTFIVKRSGIFVTSDQDAKLTKAFKR